MLPPLNKLPISVGMTQLLDEIPRDVRSLVLQHFGVVPPTYWLQFVLIAEHYDQDDPTYWSRLVNRSATRYVQIPEEWLEGDNWKRLQTDAEEDADALTVRLSEYSHEIATSIHFTKLIESITWEIMKGWKENTSPSRTLTAFTDSGVWKIPFVVPDMTYDEEYDEGQELKEYCQQIYATQPSRHFRHDPPTGHNEIVGTVIVRDEDLF